MKNHPSHGVSLGWLAIPVALYLAPIAAAEPGATTLDPRHLGIQGGLVVQLGAEDTTTPAALSRTGRYLVNVLDTDAAAVADARQSNLTVSTGCQPVPVAAAAPTRGDTLAWPDSRGLGFALPPTDPPRSTA